MDQQLSDSRDGRGSGMSSRHQHSMNNNTNDNSHQNCQRFDIKGEQHINDHRPQQSSMANSNANFNGFDHGGIRRDYNNNNNRGGSGRGGGDRGGRGRFDGRGNSYNMRENNHRGPMQQQQQQGGRGGYGRGDFDGRGGGRGEYHGGRGRGGGNRGPQQLDQSFSSQSRNNTTRPTQLDIEKSQTPIPQDQRRTLILSNIPPNIKFFHIQQHFQNNYNGAVVQYSLLDRNSNEAYVRFKFVEDAKRVWEGGNDGLDGNMVGGNNNINMDEGGENISLVKMGVKLKAIHFTNYMVDNTRNNADHNHRDRGGPTAMGVGSRGGHEAGGFDRKRNWNERYQDNNSNLRGEYHNHHSQQPPSKSPRYATEEQHHNQYEMPQSAAAASSSATIQSTNFPTNTTYHRSPSKELSQQLQQQKLSPLELQLQQQKQAEQQKAYEEFQITESKWRERRQIEYDTFISAKTKRTKHLSTLEQKRDLLSKQEDMLNKQLPLHKKMLSVIKSKNDTAEQTKKMKEILGIQTRIMELKKSMKCIVEEIEQMKKDEVTLGVFRPSEKRPVFVDGSGDSSTPGGGVAVDGGSAKKKSRLDRRTTTLKIEGFNDDIIEVRDEELVTPNEVCLNYLSRFYLRTFFTPSFSYHRMQSKSISLRLGLSLKLAWKRAKRVKRRQRYHCLR